MTEAEWLASTDPKPMLEFLRDKASDRKLRLFAVACCRRIWHLIVDRECRRAVEAAEGHADGLVTDKKLAQAAAAVNARRVSRNRPDAWSSVDDFVAHSIAVAAQSAARWAYLTDSALDSARYASQAKIAAEGSGEGVIQSQLLRDLIGNPYRPAAVTPSGRSHEVMRLAETIYDESTFDRLHELADTLQRAGCDDAALLAHCRGPGPHVRGCWAVDTVLGRT